MVEEPLPDGRADLVNSTVGWIPGPSKTTHVNLGAVEIGYLLALLSRAASNGDRTALAIQMRLLPRVDDFK